jgi:peptidoglycan/LPS O-acetylase OafA/YrhL
MQARQTHKYVTLDAIRGVAALLVLMRHTPGMWAGASFRVTYLAVDLFFVLSGFVIAKSYETKLENGSLSIGSFSYKRLVRLYPIYFLGAVLLALVGCVSTVAYDGVPSSTFSIADYVRHFFMLPSTGQGFLFPLNGPAWSLFFEIVVNIIYAVTCRMRKGRSLLEVAFVVLSAIALVIAVHGRGNLDQGFDVETMYVGFARAMFGFYMGVFGFRLTQRQNLPFAPTNGLIFAAVIACLCVPVPFRLRPYYDLSVVLFVFPALTLVASYSRTPARQMKAAEYLGAVSYPIYILHVPFYLLLTAVMRGLGIDFPARIPTGPLFALALCAVVIVLVRYYDMPTRAWLSRLASDTPALPVAHLSDRR